MVVFSVLFERVTLLFSPTADSVLLLWAEVKDKSASGAAPLQRAEE